MSWFTFGLWLGIMFFLAVVRMAGYTIVGYEATKGATRANRISKLKQQLVKFETMFVLGVVWIVGLCWINHLPHLDVAIVATIIVQLASYGILLRPRIRRITRVDSEFLV